MNRLSNSTSGKGKKGAQVVEANSVLAIVECKDGTKFTVRSHVKGKLVEVNQRLVEEPGLVVSHPMTLGYVAVVLPRIPDGVEDVKKRLRRHGEETTTGQ